MSTFLKLQATKTLCDHTIGCWLSLLTREEEKNPRTLQTLRGIINQLPVETSRRHLRLTNGSFVCKERHSAAVSLALTWKTCCTNTSPGGEKKTKFYGCRWLLPLPTLGDSTLLLNVHSPTTNFKGFWTRQDRTLCPLQPASRDTICPSGLKPRPKTAESYTRIFAVHKLHPYYFLLLWLKTPTWSKDSFQFTGHSPSRREARAGVGSRQSRTKARPWRSSESLLPCSLWLAQLPFWNSLGLPA